MHQVKTLKHPFPQHCEKEKEKKKRAIAGGGNLLMGPLWGRGKGQSYFKQSHRSHFPITTDLHSQESVCLSPVLHTLVALL